MWDFWGEKSPILSNSRGFGRKIWGEGASVMAGLREISYPSAFKPDILFKNKTLFQQLREKLSPTPSQFHPLILEHNTAGRPRRGELGEAKPRINYGSYSAQTHEGLGYKPINEDGVVQGENWALVLDGMGGMGTVKGAGAEASRIAGEKIFEFMKDPSQGGDLRRAFLVAHQALQTSSATDGGTVAVAHRIVPMGGGAFKVVFVHVGDAAGMVYRKNELGRWQQMFRTEDQSPVADAYRRGDFENTLTMRASPFANRVDSGLGLEGDRPKPVVSEFPLRPGDVVLMASDGMTDNLGRADIAGVLAQSASAEQIRKGLIQLSMDKMATLSRVRAIFRGDTSQKGVVKDRFSTKKYGEKKVVSLEDFPGYLIDINGLVYDEAGNLVDTYKADNITIHVYVHDIPGAQSPEAVHLPSDLSQRIHRNRDKEWVIPAGQEDVVVGRDFRQVQIFLKSVKASRRHARFFHGEDGAWRIEDLKSYNGTFINDVRLAPGVPAALSTGDEISFGGQKFEFRLNSTDRSFLLVPMK
jgi:PPM family protein phosphatase